MTTNHYHRPQLLETILDKLAASGKDISSLSRHDLSTVDEFHLQGAAISVALAKRVGLSPDQRVLDIGCGIGGPCRLIADEFGCEVAGVDYTAEYVRTAIELTRLVGLSEKVTFYEADALNLPFAEATFDVVWTQHAQMNIDNKTQLYAEVKRALKTNGLFVYYDIFGTEKGTPYFPVPWAETPATSHLMPHERLKSIFDEKEWEGIFFEDHTDNCTMFLGKALEGIRAGKAPSVGLNLLMGEKTLEKFTNLFQCLEGGIVEVHAGVYRKR
jgi:SAM-dependent methyltransferase